MLSWRAPNDLKGQKLTAIPMLNAGPFAIQAEKREFTVE